MIINLRNYLYNRLKKTKIIQAKYYDAKHILMSFNIENKVLLNFRNIKNTKLFKKLNYKYYDSFEVELSIKKHIYRFRLFKTFRNIDNVFYVLLLKFHRSDFEEQFLSVLMKEKKTRKSEKSFK